jgi:hypothetical protein
MTIWSFRRPLLNFRTVTAGQRNKTGANLRKNKALRDGKKKSRVSRQDTHAVQKIGERKVKNVQNESIGLAIFTAVNLLATAQIDRCTLREMQNFAPSPILLRDLD